MQKPLLFTPFKMRGVTAPNRTVVSPMVQYRATDGLVNDYHIVHLGKFALGKFGIVFTENCAVVPEGRVTQGDLGMWDDSQIEGHKRLTRFRPYRRRQRVGWRCLTFQSSNFPWRKTPLPTKRLGRRTPAAMSLRCRRMSRRCSLKEPWATCRISSGSRLALPVR